MCVLCSFHFARVLSLSLSLSLSLCLSSLTFFFHTSTPVLPNAHTCDFSLLLPAYSSYSIMRTKLLRAISEQGFDLDGGATGTLMVLPEEEDEDEDESDSDDEQ